MTNENLQKAKQLESDIVSLRNNLEIWENAVSISDQLRLYRLTSSGQRITEYIDKCYIDFDQLKHNTITRIKLMLEEKENKLAAL